MSRGFSIGRILGIKIQVDWSWLFIFFLVTWNLATVFGQAHTGWNTLLQWGLAIVAALLFFASVLAHEMAHSLVAQAQGTPVRNITLFLFGGVSNIQREPDSPRKEFFMAILGPVTSLVIGGILLGIAQAIAGPMGGVTSDPNAVIGKLGPWVTILAWLGSVNVIVGLFNLIPGFPLDGGRVLRSIFWAITGNLRKSTRWASWVGQGIGWLMIVGGLSMAFGMSIPFFGTGLINGLWLIFIGWFLQNSASRGYRQVVIHDILDDVPVTRMMRSNPPTVGPDISVDTLVHEQVMQTDDHAFPVMEGEELVGIVTLDDVRGVSRQAWGGTLVSEIMTPREELVTVSVDENAAEALILLAQHDVRQIPVMEEGHLGGLIRRRDITKWLQLQSELVQQEGRGLPT